MSEAEDVTNESAETDTNQDGIENPEAASAAPFPGLHIVPVDPNAEVVKAPIPDQRIGGNFVVPWPYEIWKDGVYVNAAKERPEDPADIAELPDADRRIELQRVTSSPVWIERFGTDIRGDVERAFLRTINFRGHPIGFWISIADLLDHRTVAALAKRGVAVTSNLARKLVAFFDTTIRLNKHKLPWVSVARRAGAITQADGKIGYLLGKHAIGLSGDIALDFEDNAASIGSYGPKGDETAWVEKLREVMSLNSLQRWLIASSFAAPLLRLLDKRTFVIHHWGATAGGKSACAKFAASVWGAPSGLMQHFNRTQMSFTEHMSFVSDMCVCFDEMQASNKNDDQGKLAYLLTLEKGRSRVKATGQLEETPGEWRAIIRTNGEEPIIGRGSENLGGQSNRVVQIYGGGMDSSVAEDIHIWLEKGHAGWGGFRFLEKLVGLLEQQGIDAVKNLFFQIRDTLRRREDASDLGERVSHISIVATAQTLMMVWLLGADPDSAFNAAVDDAFAALAAVSEDAAQQPKLADRALQLLRDHRMQAADIWFDLDDMDRAAMIERRRVDELFAVEKKAAGEAWILGAAANNLFKREGLPPRAVWIAMREAGMLAQTDGTQITVVRAFGNFRNRVYAVKLDLFT